MVTLRDLLRNSKDELIILDDMTVYGDGTLDGWISDYVEKCYDNGESSKTVMVYRYDIDLKKYLSDYSITDKVKEKFEKQMMLEDPKDKIYGEGIKTSIRFRKTSDGCYIENKYLKVTLENGDLARFPEN